MSVTYAVIETGGKQFRLGEGQVVRVPSIRAEVGSTVEFTPLVVNGGEQPLIGRPVVDGARVSCRVLGHGRERKVIIFKFKRRKHYRRKNGHRQDFTTLRVDKIMTA
jgi:large subunit ribosomal protein L21